MEETRKGITVLHSHSLFGPVDIVRMFVQLGGYAVSENREDLPVCHRCSPFGLTDLVRTFVQLGGYGLMVRSGNKCMMCN